MTDKALAADMKAFIAQSKKQELPEQLRLYEDAALLWTQAGIQCDGRAKERAYRSLSDSQKVRATISEQLGAGPQCAAAHKDAATLQDMARQALAERRWSDAAMLFRKAENMWDLASERCTGSQQEVANRRREQSEIDGQNAESCAPLFERAREHTQKLRSTAAGLSREEKQELSLQAETLWRDAIAQCKGAAVQDSARNQAQALARERGTPWVARVVPTAPPVPARPAASVVRPPAPAPVKVAASAALPSSEAPKLPGPATPVASTPTPTAAATPVSAPIKPVLAQAQLPAQAQAQPAEFTTGTTRFIGRFVGDAGSDTYSGTGKLVWANGDVFEGTLVKGLRHGKGAIHWANGQRYNGDWVNDKPVGRASVQFANGNQYEGAVLDGIPQGQGQMRYASGDSYVGQFRAGVPEGMGLYVWKNGQQFDGAWKNGRPHGLGKLNFVNGNRHEGAVTEGTPNGQGRMVYASGDIYEGNFLEGEPDGEGAFTWTNGSKYTGQWKSGKKHGQGSFTWKSGDRWEGRYENDQQTAQGKLVRKN